MNPYKVLGLEENATQEEIKNAYRRLSKENHPDTGGDPKTFMNIKKAYDMLSNKETKDAFDLYGVPIDFLKEAKELAFTVFMEVQLQINDGGPLDPAIKYFIVTGQIPKYENEMKELEEKKIKLQKRLLHILEKPEDDFITQNGLEVIDRYENDYKIVMLQRDLYKKALELLTGYQFDRLQLMRPSRRFDFVGEDGMKISFDLDAYLRRKKEFT